jgi:purine-binding chemotaxis protein CheW
MSDVSSRVGERAAEMRRDFDRAFAEPLRLDGAAMDELLAIRVGEKRYAMRSSEIVGLHAGKKTTRVPGGDAALLGIAGFRGAIVPVYDLGIVLGHPRNDTPRWLVVASVSPVALAFTAFEGQLRVSRDEIVSRLGHPDAPACAREFVRAQRFSGPILHLPTVLEAINARKDRGHHPTRSD